MVEEVVRETIGSLLHKYEALMDEVGNDAAGRKLMKLFEEEKNRLLQVEKHLEESGEDE